MFLCYKINVKANTDELKTPSRAKTNNLHLHAKFPTHL